MSVSMSLTAINSSNTVVLDFRKLCQHILDMPIGELRLWLSPTSTKGLINVNSNSGVDALLMLQDKLKVGIKFGDNITKAGGYGYLVDALAVIGNLFLPRAGFDFDSSKEPPSGMLLREIFRLSEQSIRWLVDNETLVVSSFLEASATYTNCRFEINVATTSAKSLRLSSHDAYIDCTFKSKSGKLNTNSDGKEHYPMETDQSAYQLQKCVFDGMSIIVKRSYRFYGCTFNKCKFVLEDLIGNTSIYCINSKFTKCESAGAGLILDNCTGDIKYEIAHEYKRGVYGTPMEGADLKEISLLGASSPTIIIGGVVDVVNVNNFSDTPVKIKYTPQDRNLLAKRSMYYTSTLKLKGDAIIDGTPDTATDWTMLDIRVGRTLKGASEASVLYPGYAGKKLPEPKTDVNIVINNPDLVYSVSNDYDSVGGRSLVNGEDSEIHRQFMIRFLPRATNIMGLTTGRTYAMNVFRLFREVLVENGKYDMATHFDYIDDVLSRFISFTKVFTTGRF